jgi:hypothetical protein
MSILGEATKQRLPGFAAFVPVPDQPSLAEDGRKDDVEIYLGRNSQKIETAIS